MTVLNTILSLGLLLFAAHSAHAAVTEVPPERIEAVYFDQGKVAKLFMYPGRTTLLDFPCDVTRAIGGPAGDIQWVIGATEKSELDVWLKSGTSQPTNLTVRCNHQVFVFDVIPSRTTHQEYVEIIGAYGGAQSKDAVEMKSSKAKSDEYADKKLIASSNGNQASRNQGKRKVASRILDADKAKTEVKQ